MDLKSYVEMFEDMEGIIAKYVKNYDPFSGCSKDPTVSFRIGVADLVRRIRKFESMDFEEHNNLDRTCSFYIIHGLDGLHKKLVASDSHPPK